MNNRRATVLILAGTIASLFVLLGRGQQTQRQQPPLRHEASATVKLVTVRVLDPEGRPITGLTKEDFALYEDGRQKKITEFEVHALTAAGMTSAPGLPPSAANAARSGGETNRKMFFFLDLQGSDYTGKAKAIEAALRFLDTQSRPGDEVGVLGFYSLSGFFIKQYLTTDMEQVRRAIKGANELQPSLDEMVPLPSYQVNVRSGSPVGVANELRAPLGADSEGDGGTAIMAGTWRSRRVDFVDRMKDLAEVFKTIPGNKSLVLFSARDLGQEAERLGQALGAAGTAVFAVNTRDWDINSFGTHFKHIWWDHSLKDLARASGGQYFADINDAAGIARDIQDLTGQYYVLGYYVNESWEGKYHKIRVEAARPDARVLAQDGYSDPKPFARMTDFEKDLHLLELLWSDRSAANSLPLAIDPLVIEVGKTDYACLVSRLEVGSETGIPPSPTEIIALLRDEAGKPIVSRRWEVDLTGYDGRVLWPYLVAPVPTGNCELRLVVRDRHSGSSCVGRCSFQVVAGAQEGIILHSPLLVRPGAEAAFTNLSRSKNGKSGAADKSLIELYRMIPKASHPLAGEIRSDDRRIDVVLPFERRPSRPRDEPVLAVEAKLIFRQDGSETRLEIAVQAHKKFEGMPDFLGAEIKLPALAPGEYDLEITLENVTTGERASVRRPVTVR